jgi:hypothetical protein
MKLLLDECVPRNLRRHLRPHNALTVATAGWKGIRNGTLLTLAAGAAFEAFITTDRGYEHQQNLATLPLPVVILLAHSNALPDVLPLVPKLLNTLSALNPGVTKIAY